MDLAVGAIPEQSLKVLAFRPFSLAAPKSVTVRKKVENKIQIVPQLGHDVSHLAVSADGSRLITGSPDGTAIVWDVDSGRQVQRFATEFDIPNEARIGSVSITTNRNHVLISNGKNARLWDLETKKVLRSFVLPLDKQGKKSYVGNATIAPDGNTILIGGQRGGTLFDIRTGKKLKTIESEKDFGDERFTNMTFATDGQLVLSSGSSKTILWRLADGNRIHTFEPKQGFSLDPDSAISKDGQFVLRCADSKLFVWRTDIGEQLHLIEFERGKARSAEFSPDGKLFAVVLSNRRVVFFDTLTAKEIRSITLSSTSAQFRTAELRAPPVRVLFAPDSKSVFVATKHVSRWELETGLQMKTYEANLDHGYSVDISPVGDQLAVGFATYAVLWDRQGSSPNRLDYGTVNVNPRNRKLAYSPSGKELAAATGNNLSIWDVTNPEKKRFIGGHSISIAQFACSPDGKRIATCSYDGTAIIWDVATRKLLHRLQGHKDAVWCVEFSPNGKSVITASVDRTLILWDTETGHRLREFKGHSAPVDCVAFSPDGSKILSGGLDKHAILWDAQSGDRLRDLNGHSDRISLVAFSPDGRLIVTGSLDESILISDAISGRIKRKLTDIIVAPGHLVFRPDSKAILTASYKKSEGKKPYSTVLWNLDTGEEIVRFDSEDCPNTVCFIDEKPMVVCQTFYKGRRIYDVRTGEMNVLFENSKYSHTSQEATINEHTNRFFHLHGNLVCGWNLETGKALFGIGGHNAEILDFEWTANGKRLITSGTADFHVGPHPLGDMIVLWDTDRGSRIHGFKYLDRWKGRPCQCLSLTVAPDGRRIASVVYSTTSDNGIKLFDTKKGTHKSISDRVPWTLQFSPSGHKLLAADKTSGFIDVRSKAETLKLGNLKFAALSDDGALIITAQGSSVRIVRASDGREVATLTGHVSEVKWAAIGPTNRYAYTVSVSGITRVWDIATGDELCALFALNGGKDWLVLTPEGLFDGSEGGMQKVVFRTGTGLSFIPVSRLFQDYHREGLLARIWNGERPMPTVDVSKSVPPTLKIVNPTTGGETGNPVVTLTVEVKDEGAGVKGPFLRHNGAKVATDSKVQRIDAKTSQHTFTVKLLEGENRLRFEAASGDGAWESEPAQITFTYSKSLPKPDLYLLAVGINAYAEDALKLSYAKPDAEAMVKLFSQRGRTFYEKVHVTSLMDDKATKTSLRNALREIADKARPQDTVLVYISGHGFTVGQRYYFIPSEFRFASKRFEDDVEDSGVPGNQIFREMGEAKALKRILVLDTCNSGAALQRSETKQRDGFAFAGTIRRLSRSQGIFTIAASSASEKTAEIRQLEHGVLTYSLLAGLQAVTTTTPNTADGNGDGVVNIAEWFGYAAAEVPKLTKKYLNVEQDVHQRSEGVSFAVLPLQEK